MVMPLPVNKYKGTERGARKPRNTRSKRWGNCYRAPKYQQEFGCCVSVDVARDELKQADAVVGSTEREVLGMRRVAWAAEPSSGAERRQ